MNLPEIRERLAILAEQCGSHPPSVKALLEIEALLDAQHECEFKEAIRDMPMPMDGCPFCGAFGVRKGWFTVQHKTDCIRIRAQSDEARADASRTISRDEETSLPI